MLYIIMNTCLRNVEEGDWRFLKSEAARKKTTIAGILHEAVAGYRSKSGAAGNWRKFMDRDGLLTQSDVSDFKSSVSEFRRGFRFRG
jgi:hypothetical protein